MALIKRVHTNTMETERLQKERDDLLWAIEELHTGTELARQERADAHQRVSHLEKDL